MQPIRDADFEDVDRIQISPCLANHRAVIDILDLYSTLLFDNPNNPYYTDQNTSLGFTVEFITTITVAVVVRLTTHTELNSK